MQTPDPQRPESRTSTPREYQVTARKWRPTLFSSVVGQDHVTTTLRNAIRGERVHHAYLFSGPRGVGKTTTARILARALNCLDPDQNLEPCGTCESCRAIIEGRSMDVVEIDGASNNSVDDIRNLRDSAKYPPTTGRYKLYIIDEVHMLSTSAFNALLKTLEEPPPHLIFVFATTEPHKVLPTILSRCQRFDFRRMQIDDIVSRLKLIADAESMAPEEDALVVIARKGDGSMRDAQSIFDQVRSFCGDSFSAADANEALNLIDQEFFFRVTDMMRSGEGAEAFRIVEHILATGHDVAEFLVGLAEHFRHLLSVVTLGDGRLIETTTAVRSRYEAEGDDFEEGDLLRGLNLTLDAQREIRAASQPRLRLELLLSKLAMMERTVKLEELFEAIRSMPDAPAGGTSKDGASGSGAPSGGSAQEKLPGIGRSSAPSGGGPSAPAPSMQADPSSTPAETSTLRRDRATGAIASFPTNSPPTSRPGVVRESSDLERPTDPAQPTGLTIEEISSRWPSFKSGCGGFVSAMIQPATPKEVQGNILLLRVDNDVQRKMIDDSIDDVSASVSSFFDHPFRVRAVLSSQNGDHPDPSGPASPANGNGATSHNTEPDSSGSTPEGNGSSDDDEVDHPFVKGLVELLGAVRIG